MLLNSFDSERDNTVSESEFFLYYSDLSAGIKNDDMFESMIRNAYHLSGGSTKQRVMCIFDNRDKQIVTIEDDFGIDKSNNEKLLRCVRAQGLNDIVRVDAFADGWLKRRVSEQIEKQILDFLGWMNFLR